MILLLLLPIFGHAVQTGPCSTITCPEDQTCVPMINKCMTAPCPRLPTCVPKDKTCDSHECPADQACVYRQVERCPKEPCYPAPECAAHPKCDENEEYNECSRRRCEPTCADQNAICADVSCGKGACECLIGFVRHNGTCIEQEKCPDPECPENMVFDKCPPLDPKTCRNKATFKRADGCSIASCQCKDGFVRDDDWNCVQEEKCPTKFECDDPNEEMKECSSACEPTCESRESGCVAACGPPKCQCKAGFARDNGRCISMRQCPQNG